MSPDATPDAATAQADLAFLRALVERRGEGPAGWAEGYFYAGLIYGAQMLMHAAQAFGLVPNWGPIYLLIGVGPTGVFLVVIGVLFWRRGKEPPPAAATSRAIGSVFGAVGLANLALIVVIGAAALRQQSLSTWLIYPACVFILQGAAWSVAFAMRRRGWLALVAAGWFGFAIAMGFTTEAINVYILFCGLGIWLCMALPGYLMLRQARAAA